MHQATTSPLAPVIEAGMSLQMMERRLIETTLDHYQGHRARTAKALGIGVRTLANKLRSYGYGPREKSIYFELHGDSTAASWGLYFDRQFLPVGTCTRLCRSAAGSDKHFGGKDRIW